MSSKKTSADSGTVYRSEPSLKQKKFPGRRTRVTNGRRSLPAIERQQSTLTQRWLPSSDNLDGSEDMEDIEDNNDDGGDEAKQRRKRRRTMPSSGKNGGKSMAKRQNTMTQMGFVTSFSSNFDVENEDDDDDDDDQDQIMHAASHESGEDEDKISDSVPSSQQAHEDNASERSGRVDPKESEDEMSVGVSVGRSPQSPSPELPMMEARRAASETRLPVKDSQPRTPRKRFPLEIPSSNTPQSAYIFSTQKTQDRTRERSPSRSPLRQRSLKPAQSPTKAVLSPVCETPAKLDESSFSPWSRRKTDIFRKPALPQPDRAPALVTRTTIPDSEDLPVEETQQPLSVTLTQPRRELKRVRSTIQDTQFGAFGSEVSDDVETDNDSEHHEPGGDTYQATMEYTGPYYDTVAEALNRDAARFMQTQRLRDIRRTKDPKIVLDTQEGSIEDLMASRTQSFRNTLSFASRQDLNAIVDQRKPDIREQIENDPSAHTQSLPASPETPVRSHHRPRFHDVEVVDLTAESFEPINLTAPGTPTRKRGAQAVEAPQAPLSSPVRKDYNLSSSPPLVPSDIHNVVGNGSQVEYLALNDTLPKDHYDAYREHDKPPAVSRSLLQASLMHDFDRGHGIATLPPSQISTVGCLTQAFSSQRKRPRIKPEPDDLYHATPRITTGVSEEVDLDLEDDHDDGPEVKQDILPDHYSNAGAIEHVDLSDMIGDEEDNYVDVEDIHERWGLDEQEAPKPSSPIPAPPGHSAAEYISVTRVEVSSDLPEHLTSPPHDSSETGHEDNRPSSQTSLAAHGLHAGENDHTPKGHKQGRDDEARTRRRDEEQEDEERATDTEVTPRAPPALSAKAHGKHHRPTSNPSSSDPEAAQRTPQPNELAVNIPEPEEQYSWLFRPANEILPDDDDDSQFSFGVPPIPPSSDEYYGTQREEGEQKHGERGGKGDGEDVSLAAPPKSSFGWMKKGR